MSFPQSTWCLCYGSCNSWGAGGLGWAPTDSWCTVVIQNSHLQGASQKSCSWAPSPVPSRESMYEGPTYLWALWIKTGPSASADCEWWLQSGCQSIAFPFLPAENRWLTSLIPWQHWWRVYRACFFHAFFFFFWGPGGGGRFGAAVRMFTIPVGKSDHRQSINVESKEHLKRQVCLEERGLKLRVCWVQLVFSCLVLLYLWG